MKKKNKVRDRYRKSGKMKRKRKDKLSKRDRKGKGKKVIVEAKNELELPTEKLKIEDSEVELRHQEKRCYGTDEWSDGGICKVCKWKEDCQKVTPKLQWG